VGEGKEERGQQAETYPQDHRGEGGGGGGGVLK